MVTFAAKYNSIIKIDMPIFNVRAGARLSVLLNTTLIAYSGSNLKVAQGNFDALYITSSAFYEVYLKCCNDISLLVFCVCVYMCIGMVRLLSANTFIRMQTRYKY